MIVGGIKYRSQRFNPKSASVTAIFMFVAIIGKFYTDRSFIQTPVYREYQVSSFDIKFIK